MTLVLQGPWVVRLLVREATPHNLQGLLEIKDTHRPQEVPMLLGIDLL